MAEIKIKLLSKTAKIPLQNFTDPAGADLYADIDHAVDVLPHTTEVIGTGIAVAIPKGYFGAIAPRSGLATKQGLRPANCIGIIDADYRGEIAVAMHNDTDVIRTIEPFDRIAQLIIVPYLPVTFVPVDDLDETERGTGGFGSTGSK